MAKYHGPLGPGHDWEWNDDPGNPHRPADHHHPHDFSVHVHATPWAQANTPHGMSLGGKIWAAGTDATLEHNLVTDPEGTSGLTVGQLIAALGIPTMPPGEWDDPEVKQVLQWRIDEAKTIPEDYHGLMCGCGLATK